MAIKPLECYERRVLVSTNDKLTYSTSKGVKLIVPGMLFGVRYSHDGKHFRCILNDEINKVFTLTPSDYYTLLENSIKEKKEKKEGLLTIL